MANSTTPSQGSSTPADATSQQADVPRNSDGTVDVNAFAQMAQKELSKEVDEQAKIDALGHEPAGEVGKKGTPPKGPDGKFQKQDKADVAEKTGEKTGEKKQNEHADDGRVPGSIARLQRLWHEGKVVDVLRAVTGDDSLQSLDRVKIPSRALAAVRRETARAEAISTQVQQQAQKLQSIYAPMEEVWRARDAGDVRGAIEKLFGKKLEEVQADVVASYHKTDPEVLRLRKDLEQYKTQAKQAEEQRQVEAQRTTLQQRQTEERKALTDYLTESDDVRISKVAGKKVFVDAVIQQVKDHFNPRTRLTIPWSEAAELAFEDLYGGLLDEGPGTSGRKPVSTEPPSESGVITSRVRNPVKQRNLDPNRSADAAPPDMPEPGSPDMAQYWARVAKRAMASGE
jgi:hypothetical protein